MFTQLGDTNKTVVLFILALVMALMPNTNVLSSHVRSMILNQEARILTGVAGREASKTD